MSLLLIPGFAVPGFGQYFSVTIDKTSEAVAHGVQITVHGIWRIGGGKPYQPAVIQNKLADILSAAHPVIPAALAFIESQFPYQLKNLVANLFVCAIAPVNFRAADLIAVGVDLMLS